MKIKSGENPAIDSALNDKINEAYTLIFAISSFFSPLIGSKMYLNYGFRTTFDIIAGINVIFAIILFTFNCGFNVWNENRVFCEYLEKKSERNTE